MASKMSYYQRIYSDSDEEVNKPNIMDTLKKLTRVIVKCFHEQKHLLVIDVIISQQRVTEDALANVLKFTPKMVREILLKLKSDKIIRMVTKRILGPDRKTTRETNYFINYSQLVNIVKYKLDHMRKIIVTAERGIIKDDPWLCVRCNITWTDVQLGEIFDVETLKFLCYVCGKEVTPGKTSGPKDTSLMAKFNQQTDPIYKLIKEAEDFQRKPVSTNARFHVDDR